MNDKITYCSLHTHSESSLLDAVSKPKDLVKKAAEYGHKAMALSNHGNLFGSVDFYEEAKKVGIKPIIAAELYLVDNMTDRARDYTHITILAANQKGWQNLKKLVTISNKEGFYYRARIDSAALEANSDGLICLSGCMSSKLSKLVLEGKNDEAKYWANQLKFIFKDRFFVEVMDGKVPTEDIIREASRLIAQSEGIKCVATQDSHYLNQEDWDIHEIICALDSKSRITDPTRDQGGRRKRFSTNEFWFKDAEHMLGNLTREELEMSGHIADMCEESIDFTTKRMPFYAKDAFKQLESVCNSQLSSRGFSDSTYKDRLNKELKDIARANLADYFMIVRDIVMWSKGQRIPINPGRGSAAGSLTAYLLGITGVDPVKYGLMWERFYNAGREGSMPDIDTDVCKDRRGEVINYVKEKFGHDRVANIMSVDTFQVRASIREVGRCIGLPVHELEKATKDIPLKGVNTVDEAEVKVSQVSDLFKKYPQLKNLARKATGLKRHITMHPSAIVVADEDLSAGSIPLAYNASQKMLMTGLDMYELESLGHLKLDLLGLNTTTLISSVENSVGSCCA